ncbi:unnamed protein product, partial [Notodromas monacha]
MGPSLTLLAAILVSFGAQLQPTAANYASANCLVPVPNSDQCITDVLVNECLAEALNEVGQYLPTAYDGGVEHSHEEHCAIGKAIHITGICIKDRLYLSSALAAKLLPQVDVSYTGIWGICPAAYKSDQNIDCTPHLRYRRPDGYCTQGQAYPWWGASDRRILRPIPPEFDDALGELARGQGDHRLPAPRLVTTSITVDRYPRIDKEISFLHTALGQVIGHDIQRSGPIIHCATKVCENSPTLPPKEVKNSSRIEDHQWVTDDIGQPEENSDYSFEDYYDFLLDSLHKLASTYNCSETPADEWNLTEIVYFGHMAPKLADLGWKEAGQVAVFAFISIAALLGNVSAAASLIYSQLWNRALRALLLNLAFADALTCTVCLWIFVVDAISGSQWIMGPFMCTFGGFL